MTALFDKEIYFAGKTQYERQKEWVGGKKRV